MALDNYRDLSSSSNDVSAGFQFEFACSNCSRKWKSPFKPYRMGQITGLLTRFTFLFSGIRDAGRASGNFADIGSRGAKQKALDEAMQRAETLYTNCSSCRQAFCGDCFSSRDDSCLPCLQKDSNQAQRAGQQAAEQAASASAHACPNCGTGNPGGRFCAECGFDMASTHKACPACGQMALRQARFCTDCGHGF
jgi:ribosomal protein L32